jgi:hypothetical protein
MSLIKEANIPVRDPDTGKITKHNLTKSSFKVDDIQVTGSKDGLFSTKFNETKRSKKEGTETHGSPFKPKINRDLQQTLRNADNMSLQNHYQTSRKDEEPVTTL